MTLLCSIAHKSSKEPWNCVKEHIASSCSCRSYSLPKLHVCWRHKFMFIPHHTNSHAHPPLQRWHHHSGKRSTAKICTECREVLPLENWPSTHCYRQAAQPQRYRPALKQGPRCCRSRQPATRRWAEALRVSLCPPGAGWETWGTTRPSPPRWQGQRPCRGPGRQCNCP
jgi:hypothetical protein